MNMNESHKNIVVDKCFKCEICDANFKKQSKLKRHKDSVHDGKRPFKCSVCDNRFAQKDQVNRHVLSVHERKKPFNCKICDATFF